MLPRNRAGDGVFPGVVPSGKGREGSTGDGDELSTLWSKPHPMGTFEVQTEPESQVLLESRGPPFCIHVPQMRVSLWWTAPGIVS